MRKAKERGDLRKAVLVVKKVFPGSVVLKPVTERWKWNQVICGNCGARFGEVLAACPLCGAS